MIRILIVFVCFVWIFSKHNFYALITGQANYKGLIMHVMCLIHKTILYAFDLMSALPIRCIILSHYISTVLRFECLWGINTHVCVKLIKSYQHNSSTGFKERAPFTRQLNHLENFHWDHVNWTLNCWKSSSYCEVQQLEELHWDIPLLREQILLERINNRETLLL